MNKKVVNREFIPLNISLAPRPKIIKSTSLSDNVHSALFKPPDEVLPDTLPLITSILNPSAIKLSFKTTDKWCSLDKPYPAIKLSPNNTTFSIAYTFMVTRQRTIILIIKLLFMSILLKLKKVNLKYQTGKDNIRVLKDINLTTKKKETISIVGESGSGKTSLIMLIGGLEKATSGKIFFQNHEITKLNEDEVSEIRRKNIGIIFQSFYLIPNYSAVENVALTLELNKFKNPEKEAKLLLDRFGLSHRFNNLPSQLSGGEQQRVAIARAIAMKPELILADEPTGNLDTENSVMISDILFKYVKEEGSSLIMVTHDPKLANKAKRKIRIKDGKIK